MQARWAIVFNVQAYIGGIFFVYFIYNLKEINKTNEVS